MTGDLFDNGEPRLLGLPDADIRYWSRIDLGAPVDRILQELIDRTPWRSEVIALWGQEHRQPRLTAWFGDPGARYTYSGLALEPLPWTDLLADIRSRVEALTLKS